MGYVPGLSSGCSGPGVHAQGQTASASLGGVALARHVTLAASHGRATRQLVTAEALSAVFGTGHAVSGSSTVSHALRVGDFVVADIRKFDAGQHTRVEVVREAAVI